MQVNDEDSNMSDFNNDQSGNGGQLATMPNGCFSSQLFIKNESSQSMIGSGQQSMTNPDNNNLSMDMGISSSSEYNGYQISFLNQQQKNEIFYLFLKLF